MKYIHSIAIFDKGIIFLLYKTLLRIRAQRDGRLLSLLMLNIDYFKKYQ